jgi:hypothetical protein
MVFVSNAGASTADSMSTPELLLTGVGLVRTLRAASILDVARSHSALVWLKVGSDDVANCSFEAQARGQERLNPDLMEGCWVRL